MKSNKKIMALAGILGVAAIGGTFAYFNQTDSVVNQFKTGVYHNTLVEDFKPKDGENWEPGTEVNKDVYITNDGTLDVVVRVKFAEKWERGSETLYELDTTDKKAASDPDHSTSTKFENVYQADPKDGKTGADDDSVVHKTLNLGEDWVYNVNDGYYYYKHILKAPEEGEVSQTSYLLDAVQLDENVDMGKFFEHRYYTTVEDPKTDNDWVEFVHDEEYKTYENADDVKAKLEKEGKEILHMKAEPELAEEDGKKLKGYSDANYTLTVTADSVQATSGAVHSIFELTDEAIEALGCDWNLEDESEEQIGD